jgi:hypothetical protein
MELLDFAKELGPLIGVVLFFIWRDWRREEGLVDRVKGLEEFNNEVLTDLVKQCVGVIATNTEQLRIMNALMQKCKGRDNG